jgi:hypothetical protein
MPAAAEETGQAEVRVAAVADMKARVPQIQEGAAASFDKVVLAL